MANDEIPSELWELRNEILSQLQDLTSNYHHIHYKRDWGVFGFLVQRQGKLIEKLADQYVQPNEE